MIKRYFITGLLIWVPLTITLWVLSLLIGLTDQVLLFLPEALQPKRFLDLPGIGIAFVILIIFSTGVLAANIIGQRLVLWWEILLNKIPVVSPIYSSVKQVSDSLFSSSGHAFSKVLLVEYPRKGAWTIAFKTGHPSSKISQFLTKECISVYVPTTPNPTSGFFLLLPENEVIELSMSVDEALKYIISMGVVSPQEHR